jgi:hypothetical protein
MSESPDKNPDDSVVFLGDIIPVYKKDIPSVAKILADPKKWGRAKIFSQENVLFLLRVMEEKDRLAVLSNPPLACWLMKSSLSTLITVRMVDSISEPNDREPILLSIAHTLAHDEYDEKVVEWMDALSPDRRANILPSIATIMALRGHADKFVEWFNALENVSSALYDNVTCSLEDMVYPEIIKRLKLPTAEPSPTTPNNKQNTSAPAPSPAPQG